MKAPANYPFTVIIKADPQDDTMNFRPGIGKIEGAANQLYNIPKESIILDKCDFTAEDIFRKLDGYEKDGNTVTAFI